MQLSEANTEPTVAEQPGTIPGIRPGDGAADLNAIPPEIKAEKARRISPEAAGETLDAINQSIQGARQKVSHWAQQTFDGIVTFADERPVHFAAIVAGTAFAIGVTLRIWRSAHYE